MIPVNFPEANAVLAMDQEEYEPIVIYRFVGPEGRIVCCFRLTDAEIHDLVSTRTLWFEQLTFGHPFNPIRLSTQRPGDLPEKQHG